MKKINLFGVLAVVFALVVGVSFTSCKDDKEKTDPDAGKTDPSTIASTNLVAYFPFDSESASISKGDGLSFVKKAGAASFVTGRRGNAYKGSVSQAYLEYNVAATNLFKSLSEYSYSAWIKSPKAEGGAASIFLLNGGDPGMGNFCFVLESGSNADSLALKSYLYNSTTNWQGQDLYGHSPAFLSDKWVHIVSTYNKTTSTMSFYANGVFVKDQVKYSNSVQENGIQPLLGALTLKSDMTKFYVGAWHQLVAGVETDSWRVYYPGLLDELRIYNKALTPAEIKALYDAEVTQIN
ncbi:MAG: LamG domain-containing protein [Paludibacteraceae bacterium]